MVKSALPGQTGAGGSFLKRTYISQVRSGSPPLVDFAQTALDPGPGHPLLPLAPGSGPGHPHLALAPGSGPGHPLHAGSGSPPAGPLPALLPLSPSPSPPPFSLLFLPFPSPPPPSLRPGRFFWALGYLESATGSPNPPLGCRGVRKCRWRRARRCRRLPGSGSPPGCDLVGRREVPGPGRPPLRGLVEIGPDPGPGRPPVRDLVAWPPRSGPGRPQCGTWPIGALTQARVAPPLSGPGRPRARDSVKSGLGEMSRRRRGGSPVVAGRSAGPPGPRSGVLGTIAGSLPPLPVVDPPSPGRRWRR